MTYFIASAPDVILFLNELYNYLRYVYDNNFSIDVKTVPIPRGVPSLYSTKHSRNNGGNNAGAGGSSGGKDSAKDKRRILFSGWPFRGRRSKGRSKKGRNSSGPRDSVENQDVHSTYGEGVLDFDIALPIGEDVSAF